MRTINHCRQRSTVWSTPEFIIDAIRSKLEEIEAKEREKRKEKEGEQTKKMTISDFLIREKILEYAEKLGRKKEKRKNGLLMVEFRTIIILCDGF